MAFLYKRHDSRHWWVCWTDVTGERHRESTGLADLEAARQVLQTLERRVAARRKLPPAAMRTVTDHVRAQVEARARRGDLLARDEAATLLEYLSGPLGGLQLCDVRHQDVMEWIRALPERQPLGAQPARALYMQLYRVFEDAVAEGLLPANPCRADLEPQEDTPAVDVSRRLSNYLTREELGRLLSDPRLDRFRRCQWAVLSLTGARVGEALGLRVRHCDLQRLPLNRLLVTGRWDSKQRRIVPPRSGLPREVPLHRSLAVMLFEHVREVLPGRLGRPARPDDFLFPALDGTPQQAGTVLSHLQRDMELVGLRRGNLHTLRRTFFALGRQGGASPQVLRLVAEEGRPGDRDVPYAAKCAEITKLDVPRLVAATLDEPPPMRISGH